MKQFYTFLTGVIIFALLACGFPSPSANNDTYPQSTLPPQSTSVPMSTSQSDQPIGSLGAPRGDAGSNPLIGAPDIKSKEQEFVEFVFKDVDEFWQLMFSTSHLTYSSPVLHYIDEPGIVTNNCTSPLSDKPQLANAGPFYCHTDSDEDVYMIQAEEWGQGLPQGVDDIGDFATAVIVAHEMGHHVQNLLSITNSTPAFELQADCLAGVWAYMTFARGMLEPGDIEEAMVVLTYIGDDSLGIPLDQYSHGTAAERKAWFMVGYDTGQAQKCDPYTAVDNPPSSPTQVVTTPQNSNDPIAGFFINASNETCAIVTDTVAETVKTIRCTFADGTNTVQVDYDQWTSDLDWSLSMTNWNFATIESWNSLLDNSIVGSFTAGLDKNGKALVFWGVSGKAITGTIYWYNNNIDAAKQWFFKYGNAHYVN